MNINLNGIFNKNDVIAVALSGGSDSMALLHYLFNNAKKLGVSIKAINVEHGIRGKSSLSDSLFVKNYCEKHNIPLISYSVDAVKKSKEEKLSLEESARILRYECFFDAIKNNKCNFVATAHHLSDNAETILFNLFRGASLEGVKGIKKVDEKNKIIRPFINVSKNEILEYIKKNKIPFVTDKTNFDENYSRNFIRLSVMPKIKEHFPKAEESICRFAEISALDNEYLNGVAESNITYKDGKYKIPVNLDRAILNRCVIIILKNLGLIKDFEKKHTDLVFNLINLQTGKSINLPKNIIAVKEYDNLTFFKNQKEKTLNMPFNTCNFCHLNVNYIIEKVNKKIDVKKGLFFDIDKVPKDSVIRTKKQGDLFTKFRGGTKSLKEFFIDKKIPSTERNNIPLIASKNKVLAIFNLAISDDIKIDDSTKNICQLITKEY